MDFITNLFDLDLSQLVPEMSQVLDKARLAVTVSVLAGPILLLVLGLIYFFIPPKEANHHLGYRSYWSMGSVQVWQYAQRLSGMIFMIGGGGLAVIMLILCLFFGMMQPSTMVITSLVCVIIEALAAIAAVVVIEVMLRKHYDIHGNKR